MLSKASDHPKTLKKDLKRYPTKCMSVLSDYGGDNSFRISSSLVLLVLSPPSLWGGCDCATIDFVETSALFWLHFLWHNHIIGAALYFWCSPLSTLFQQTLFSMQGMDDNVECISQTNPVNCRRCPTKQLLLLSILQYITYFPDQLSQEQPTKLADGKIVHPPI